jgi:hypothetical protein
MFLPALRQELLLRRLRLSVLWPLVSSRRTKTIESKDPS